MSEYNGSDRRTPEAPGWHLDKKVPLSLIFAMIVQAGMVILAIADIKKDVEILKAQSTLQVTRDTRQDSDMREAMSLLREQFSGMNSKLDRLIERDRK
jgi:hypothetical protein